MDAAPLQELTAKVLGEDAYLCDLSPAAAFRKITKQSLGIRMFAGENPTYGAPIYYYFARAPKQTPQIVITDKNGTKVAEANGFTEPGLHKLNWRLNVKGAKENAYAPVPAGTYTVVLQVGDRELRKTIAVEADD
jgi:hypothetical protein